MKKNVYSVVLSEEVVAAVDRVAYAVGTNRSDMINRILAEYVSFETPEMKMQSIFEGISALLEGSDRFKRMPDTGRTVMNLRSPIVYKYNPSVRYSIELYRTAVGESIGELRAVLRTQNVTLIEFFSEFCRLFDAVEREYGVKAEALSEEGRYCRQLLPRRNASAFPKGTEQTLGDAIGDFVTLFDNSLKLFFQENCRREVCKGQLQKLYAGYVSENPILV